MIATVRRLSLVSLVLVLCSGLFWTSATNARAETLDFQNKAFIKTFGTAGVKATAIPRVLTLSSPLGFTVGAGLLAYSTADLWLPYVKGMFGAQGEVTGTEGGFGCVMYPSFVGGTTGTNINNATVNVIHPADDTDPATQSYYGYRSTSLTACPSTGGTTTFLSSQDPATVTLQCKSTSGAGGVTYYTRGETVRRVVRGAGTSTAGILGCPVGSVPLEFGVSKMQASNNTSYAPAIVYRGSGITHADTGLSTDLTCRRPDATTYTKTLSSTGTSSLGVPTPACTDGDRPSSATIRGGSPGATGAMPVVQTITWPTTSAEYPDCVNGPVCSLTIKVDGVLCDEGMEACTRWPEIANQSPGRVACFWGPYSVPLDQCGIMEGAYVPGGRTVTTEADIDGKPGTAPTPTSGTGTGTAASPTTQPTTQPTPQPSAGTGTGLTPGELANGVKDGVTGAGTGTATDPDGSSCIAGAFSWNPVDWVYVPVKCATIWAFGIKPSTLARLDTVKATAMTKPPMSLAAGAPGLAAVLPGVGAGCPSWQVKVGGYSGDVICGQGYTERLHDWRNLTGTALVALALAPFLRSVWYAGIPVLRVTPHQ